MTEQLLKGSILVKFNLQLKVINQLNVTWVTEKKFFIPILIFVEVVSMNRRKINDFEYDEISIINV